MSGSVARCPTARWHRPLTPRSHVCSGAKVSTHCRPISTRFSVSRCPGCTIWTSVSSVSIDRRAHLWSHDCSPRSARIRLWSATLPCSHSCRRLDSLPSVPSMPAQPSNHENQAVLVTHCVRGAPKSDRRAENPLTALGALVGRLHRLEMPTGAADRPAGALHHYAEGTPADELSAARRCRCATWTPGSRSLTTTSSISSGECCPTPTIRAAFQRRSCTPIRFRRTRSSQRMEPCARRLGRRRARAPTCIPSTRWCSARAGLGRLLSADTQTWSNSMPTSTDASGCLDDPSGH